MGPCPACGCPCANARAPAAVTTTDEHSSLSAIVGRDSDDRGARPRQNGHYASLVV
jgi:hypothetical protein